MYIKAHPFGYTSRKSEIKAHLFEPKSKKRIGKKTKNRVQLVTIKVPYEVTVRDKNGKPVLNEDKVPVTETFYNTIQRPIQHYGRELKGKTLAGMVYESLLMHYGEAKVS